MKHTQILFAGSALLLGGAFGAAARAADHGDQPFANASSLCAESGLNDIGDDSALERLFDDPGGRVQSFGFSLGWGSIQDSEKPAFDPRSGTPFPGFYCNPTRFDFSGR